MRGSPRKLSLGWTWVASVALHALAIGSFGWAAMHVMEQRVADDAARAPRGDPDGVVSIELPSMSDGTVLAPQTPPDRTGDPPPTLGGAVTPSLDNGARGHGGAPRASLAAVNLSDRDERTRLTPDDLSHLDGDQLARIKSARARASYEDRRSTTHPSELTFLASGEGERASHRTPSPSDPSRGLRASAPASAKGGELGSPADGAGDLDRAGASNAGAAPSSPGAGVHDGRAGRDHRRSADVARARPDVTLAAVSIPATDHARPEDDVDSEQRVALAVRSIVHASTSGGAPGDGAGGSGVSGDPGAGGVSGVGARGRPLGAFDDAWLDDSADPRLVTYFRKLHAKIHPLWAAAFPKSAIAEIRQGFVIFEVTIEPDGTAKVAWPPARPSGIEDFDRNCYDAIVKATPFDPVPAALGKAELHVRMPFDARNPVIN